MGGGGAAAARDVWSLRRTPAISKTASCFFFFQAQKTVCKYCYRTDLGRRAPYYWRVSDPTYYYDPSGVV